MSNAFTGTNGNDRLTGTTGADILQGGAGDDTYVVNNVGDKVVENDNALPNHNTKLGGLGGNGLDTVGFPDISPDGTKIAFYGKVQGQTDSNYHVYIKDLLTGEVTRVDNDLSGVTPQGHASSLSALNITFTPNGKGLIFESKASTLVSSDTNNVMDIFHYNLETKTITRISEASNGEQLDKGSFMANLSADGTKLVYLSQEDSSTTSFLSGKTVKIHVRDMTTGTVTDVLSDTIDVGTLPFVSISPDGSKVMFSTKQHY